MRRPELKSPTAVLDPAARKAIVDLNEAVDVIRGRLGKKTEILQSNATLSDVIDKVNEIIELLQA